MSRPPVHPIVAYVPRSRGRPRKRVAPDLVGFKRCPDCTLVLELSAFYRATKRPDGVQDYCKGCHRIRIDAGRNRERVAGYARNYRMAHATERSNYARFRYYSDLEANRARSRESVRLSRARKKEHGPS